MTISQRVAVGALVCLALSGYLVHSRRDLTKDAESYLEHMGSDSAVDAKASGKQVSFVRTKAVQQDGDKNKLAKGPILDDEAEGSLHQTAESSKTTGSDYSSSLQKLVGTSDLQSWTTDYPNLKLQRSGDQKNLLFPLGREGNSAWRVSDVTGGAFNNHWKRLNDVSVEGPTRFWVQLEDLERQETPLCYYPDEANDDIRDPDIVNAIAQVTEANNKVVKHEKWWAISLPEDLRSVTKDPNVPQALQIWTEEAEGKRTTRSCPSGQADADDLPPKLFGLDCLLQVVRNFAAKEAANVAGGARPKVSQQAIQATLDKIVEANTMVVDHVKWWTTSLPESLSTLAASTSNGDLEAVLQPWLETRKSFAAPGDDLSTKRPALLELLQSLYGLLDTVIVKRQCAYRVKSEVDMCVNPVFENPNVPKTDCQGHGHTAHSNDMVVRVESATATDSKEWVRVVSIIAPEASQSRTPVPYKELQNFWGKALKQVIDTAES